METIWLEYGEAATVDFVLLETDGVDFKVDAAHAAGDTKIMKDEGAEANTSNGFTDEGIGYSLALTAAELQAARVMIYVIDQGTKAWLDKELRILTYGDPSAADPRGISRKSTAQGGGTTTITLDTGAVATDDFYNGMFVEVYGGTGAGQIRAISDYVGSTKVATVDTAWTTNPDNTSKFRIYLAAPVSAGSGGATAGEIADAVWDEALSGHTTAGTSGERIGRIPNAAAASNGGLPTVDANNRVAGIVGTINTLDGLDTAQDTQHATTQSRLPAALSSGRMVAAVEAIDATSTAAIADKILGRAVAGGSDGGRTVQQALRRLRNRVAVAAGTMTVYQENDSSADWTAAVTTTAGDPVSEVDPA